MIANPVRAELVEVKPFCSFPAMRLQLQLHPDCRCDSVDGIEVTVVRPSPATLALGYSVTGDIADLALPPLSAPARADGLWQHTCFEAFVRASGEGYYEFNFAPSTLWAAYRFDSYRSGMDVMEVRPPQIEASLANDRFELEAAVLELEGLDTARLALSAVIEERNGRKSYWALAHPAAKPDFHHPDSFVCEL